MFIVIMPLHHSGQHFKFASQPIFLHTIAASLDLTSFAAIKARALGSRVGVEGRRERSHLDISRSHDLVPEASSSFYGGILPLKSSLIYFVPFMCGSGWLYVNIALPNTFTITMITTSIVTCIYNVRVKQP